MSDSQWFESRMLAHAAGLLSDPEVERFESLRDSDRSCQALWAEFLGDADLSDGFHMPAGMVAQWPKAASSLGELERRAVEDHLSSCTSCAEEISLFGTDARARTSTPPRSITPTPRRSQWSSAITGGIVGALAMAAVLLLLVQPGPAPDSGGALPWAAPSRVRSDQLPAFSRVKLGAETRQIGLNLAVPQALDPFRPAQISVYGPGAALIQQFEAPASEMGRGALVLLVHSDEPFEPGSYRVLFAQEGNEAELWFEVERPAN
jgi:hypothetical protein